MYTHICIHIYTRHIKRAAASKTYSPRTAPTTSRKVLINGLVLIL